MFLDTASAILLSTPETPHLLHEDWRPAPPPSESQLCLSVVLRAEERLKHTAADADCMGSGRSLQGILAAAGEYAAGGEAEAGQGRVDSA